MTDFDHILNWKLRLGSHPFPGKDGGTCINEAALVTVGFPYRPITRAEDMPDCFSRPICRLAMRLNDRAGDADRQRLLPYVTRLACADTPEIERERAAYIAQYTGCDFSFQKELKVLEGALAIGRQADAIPFEDVRTRMDDAKSSAKGDEHTAAKPASFTDAHLLSKLKSWLKAAKKPEPVG